MEQRKPPEYQLEIFADPTSIKDVVRAVLHTIFFHRYFPSIRPTTFEILDFTLPAVPVQEIEAQIDTRVGQLIRQLKSTSSPRGSTRGTLTVHFFEKKLRKGGTGLGWFGGVKAEEDIIWEKWNLEVTLATPKTEDDCTKVVKAVASSLQKTIMKVIASVNRDKEHIPLVTSSDASTFPYKIDLNPKMEGRAKGMGGF